MAFLPRSFRRNRSAIMFFLTVAVLLIGCAHYFDMFSSDIVLYSQKYIRFYKYKQSEPYRIGPGEQGAALYLEGEEAKLANNLIEKEAFNRIASDKISLERSIIDVRNNNWRIHTKKPFEVVIHGLGTCSNQINMNQETYQ